MKLSELVETLERLNPHRHWRVEKHREAISITISVGGNTSSRTLLLPVLYSTVDYRHVEFLVLDMIAELNRSIACQQ